MQRCIKIECGVCQWNIEKPILYNNEIQHLSTFSTVIFNHQCMYLVLS